MTGAEEVIHLELCKKFKSHYFTEHYMDKS